MSVWFGGLALLAYALPAATRRLDGADRPALLAAALMRFSPLALTAVVVLTVTGVAQALVYLDSFTNFVDTAFGRALLVKIALLLMLVGLGALNRQRMLPTLQRIVERKETSTGKVGLALRRSIRAEVLLLVAVLGTTAVLVNTVPSGSEMAGPESGNVIAENGDFRIEYTVDPAAPGANELHLYLFSEADGSQFDPEEVTAEASLPDGNIGPIPVDLTKSGPGHYTGLSAPFGVQGDWQVVVHVRTSRFDQTNLEFEVEIR